MFVMLLIFSKQNNNGIFYSALRTLIMKKAPKYYKTQNIFPTLFSPTHEELLFQPVLNLPSYNIDYILYENVYSPTLNWAK